MKKRGYETRPESLHNLEGLCKEEWPNFPLSVCFNLLKSNRTLAAVLLTKEGFAKFQHNMEQKINLQHAIKNEFLLKALNTFLTVVPKTVGGSVKIRATTRYKGF